MKAKKAKAKKQKPSDVMLLYRAVQEYVETRGGKIIVAGGVQIIAWPGESAFNFTVGIRVTGRAPDYATGDASEVGKDSR